MANCVHIIEIIYRLLRQSTSLEYVMAKQVKVFLDMKILWVNHKMISFPQNIALVIRHSTGYLFFYIYYRCPFSSVWSRSNAPKAEVFSEHADEFIIEVCEKKYPMIQKLPIIHELCNIVYFALTIFTYDKLAMSVPGPFLKKIKLFI